MAPDNWKWEIKGGKPLIFIDTHDVPDAMELVKPLFHKDTSMREEKDHLDKNKTLIVALIEYQPGYAITTQLEALVKRRPYMDRLFCAYVVGETVMNPLNWRLADDGVSLEVKFHAKVFETNMLEAVRKAKSKILTMLIEKLKIPATGHLYLSYAWNNYDLVWHACERCDQDLVWYEPCLEKRHWDFNLRV
jgi:hypothetical protein